MAHVDGRLVVLSSKRSTHHAFLEGLLTHKRYLYDNNVTVTKSGDVDVNRTVQCHEPAEAPMIYVASFERQYSLPALYSSAAFRGLLAKHESREAPRMLIFLRDPLNTLASIYSAHLKTDYFANFNYVTDNLQQWVNVAQYLLNGLDGEAFIYANRFWADDEYRRSCLNMLGMDGYLRDDKLSTFGGGGNTYLGDKKGPITPAALQSRYLNYAEDERYLGLVREHRDLFSAFCKYVDDDAMLTIARDLYAVGR